MAEILVGVIALLIGGIFAFQGGSLMRIMFPLIGFFSGFSAGAAMVAGITGDGFLGTVLGWVVGFFVALLFALLAYFFYAFAIVMAFAGLGFSLTAAVLSVFNIDWNWLVVILGSATGIVFGIVALITGLPMLVLIAATSFFGVAVMIYGLLLIFNIASFGDFSNGAVYEYIRSKTGVYILWVTAGITACLTQIRILGEQMKAAQEYWDSSVTFEDLMQVETTSSTKKKR